eukprot:TRINITY_DN2274_c3_g1_i1.p1 TRINITY_DN2274_c3_g1~~TRINITY_DN2274_c3_g1_i1.p1  ORF type:complete len:343 (+),score=75.95 TRINITY_DN2274_c3_g1_i1:611-1639(+)
MEPLRSPPVGVSPFDGAGPRRRQFGAILRASGLPLVQSDQQQQPERQRRRSSAAASDMSGADSVRSDVEQSPTACASISPSLSLRRTTSFGAPAPTFFAAENRGQHGPGCYVDSYGTVVPEGDELQQGVATLSEDAVDVLLASPTSSFTKFMPEDRSFHEAASRTVKDCDSGTVQPRPEPLSVAALARRNSCPIQPTASCVPPAAIRRRESASVASAHSDDSQSTDADRKGPVRVRILYVQPRQAGTSPTAPQTASSPGLSPTAPPVAQPLRRSADQALPAAIPLSPQLTPNAAPGKSAPADAQNGTSPMVQVITSPGPVEMMMLPPCTAGVSPSVGSSAHG